MDIIIADDEPVTRLLLAESLKSWGYNVYALENGREALTLFNEKPEIQLFLIDWSMPEMSGIELCRKIKDQSDIISYVVMLTNKSGTDSVVEAMDAGADDYLTKPFVPAELKVRIRAGCRIIEQEKKLQFYANFDALTGVWNRRMILNHLEIEWSRSNREGSNLFVAILDLDYFKQINDNYGHQVGDDALKLFCKLVQEQIRPYDYFGRYGGEEFLLVMPMAKQEDSLFIAERIRLAVSESSLKLVNQDIIQFTVSIGCSKKHKDDKSFENLISRADEAVYKAKNEGRNQVIYL